MKLLYGFVLLWMISGCTPNIGPMDKQHVDFQKVLPLAERCSSIYNASDKELKRSFPNIVSIQTIDAIDMRFMVERFEDRQLQIVTLRGTANLENAKQDLEYLPSRNKKLGIYVHKGFDRDAYTLYKVLKPLLQEGYRIQVTGHSLGASVAALIMIYLHEDGFVLEPTVNFGQPKFTNHAGARKYAFLPLVRFIDANDPVPLVPPATVLDSLHGIYEHLSAEVILLDRDYYCYLNRHQSETASEFAFWNNIGDIALKAHSMNNYLHNIKTKTAASVEVPYSKREAFIASRGY